MNKKQTKPKHDIKVKSVEAKTDNHRDYIRAIIEKDITIAVGVSGSGKSFMAAGISANMLHDGRFEKIIITRPLVSCGVQGLGFLPGGVEDKIMPYMIPMINHFRYFLTPAFFGLYINERKIIYEPLETMRGKTYDKSIIVLDEGQNCTLAQLKLFITRLGKESKIIINGDYTQGDLKDKSGLCTVVEKLEGMEEVAIIRMEKSDIMRNGIIGKILSRLEQ